MRPMDEPFYETRADVPVADECEHVWSAVVRDPSDGTFWQECEECGEWREVYDYEGEEA